jgi:ribosome-associated protein
VDTSDAPDGAAVPRASGGGVGSALRVTPTVSIPAEELSWRFSRSSGPGGQGVNTTDSRVELSWDVATTTALSQTLRVRALERLAGRLVGTSVVVVASELRRQRRNRDLALERLAALVREAIAPAAPPRRPTRPSRAQRMRRVEDKRHRGETKRRRGAPDPRGRDL